MSDSRFRRYALVQCQVFDHQPYGLLVQTGDGQRGFVDSGDIADEPVSPDRWPRIGESLPCVVMGYARDGRVRANSRPSYVAFIGATTDPELAISNWIRIRDDGFRDPAERATFFGSPAAAPTLRWALRQFAGSVDRARAAEILADAPEDLARAVRQ